MANKKLGVVAIAAATVLLFAGCSSSNNASDPVSGVKADPAAAALLPASYKDAGIEFASDIPWQPFEYVENGKTTGLDYDIAQLIAAKLGTTFAFKKQSFDTIIASLQAGKHDAIASDMNDTKERQATLDFIDYYKSGSSLIVLAGNPDNITDLKSLCGKTVIAEKATSQVGYLQTLAKTCPVTVLELPDAPSAENALRAGKGVAFMVDSPVAGYTAKTAGAGKYFEVAVDPANPAGYEPTVVGIGVLKEQFPELRDAIKAALDSALKDGSYKAVLDKYGLGAGALTKITINAGK